MCPFLGLGQFSWLAVVGKNACARPRLSSLCVQFSSRQASSVLRRSVPSCEVGRVLACGVLLLPLPPKGPSDCHWRFAICHENACRVLRAFHSMTCYSQDCQFCGFVLGSPNHLEFILHAYLDFLTRLWRWFCTLSVCSKCCRGVLWRRKEETCKRANKVHHNHIICFGCSPVHPSLCPVQQWNTLCLLLCLCSWRCLLSL